MQSIIKEVGNYVLSIILIVLGALFLVMYLKSSSSIEAQPIGMLVGSLFMIVAGIVALPIVSNKIHSGISKIVLLLAILASAYLGYSVVDTIDDEVQFRADTEIYNKEVVQSLKDIRDAQTAYQRINGIYTDNWDSLINFSLEPLIPVYYRSGTFHDTIEGGMEEYNTLGYIIQRDDIDSIANDLGVSSSRLTDFIAADKIHYKILDTSYVSFYDENFSTEARAKDELKEVELDKLPFNPISGERFILQTSQIDNGGVPQSVVQVKDPTPFGRENVKKDTLMFGSLYEAHTDGNWKKEK